MSKSDILIHNGDKYQELIDSIKKTDDTKEDKNEETESNGIASDSYSETDDSQDEESHDYDSENEKRITKNEKKIIDTETNDFIAKNKYYFYACTFGALSYPVLYILGFKVGQEGVAYYGEVHQQSWNCYMHTLGMPFTIYGMQLWIPALLTNNIVDANKLQKALYLGYLTHYSLIDRTVSLFYIPFYGLPTYNAIQNYRNTEVVYEKRRFYLFCYGFAMSFFALLFQEVAGHWYGGDDPSRFEAIFNAILYAKFFSISHMIY